jgi:hypothetical protein
MINKALGFYVCNGQEFSSKIRALLYSNEVNKPVEWIFNDRVFQSYDWSIEPEETLDQLYDKRARDLRAKYDYVILSYSGGADSHNILMSFFRQGLHIDEILVNHFEKAAGKFVDLNPANTDAKNAGAEHYLQTIPRLKEIAPKIPKTKITLVDMSDHLFGLMETTGDASWVLTKREGINPAGATRFNYLHLGEVRKKFDKEKSICMIVGVEKPRANISAKGHLIIRFIDRAANQQTVSEHLKDYTNSTAEFFYWSPDSVRMLIKQGHVIKKYLSANPAMQRHWWGPNITFETVRLVHERILRTLMYSTWDNSYWQADKSTSDWHSEFDLWFKEGYSDSKAVNIWKEGVEYVNTSLSNYVNANGDGLKHFHKYYDCGPVLNLLPEFTQK